MKFDFATLYPIMAGHRSCTAFISESDRLSQVTSISGSSDSFWMSQETTCLQVQVLECHGTYYWFVPVHTSMYGTTVRFSYSGCLARQVVPCCTGTYWYVPVCTDLPGPILPGRCPGHGVKDSRCDSGLFMPTLQVRLRLLEAMPTLRRTRKDSTARPGHSSAHA